jgi:hypothetical protein
MNTVRFGARPGPVHHVSVLPSVAAGAAACMADSVEVGQRSLGGTPLVANDGGKAIEGGKCPGQQVNGAVRRQVLVASVIRLAITNSP